MYIDNNLSHKVDEFEGYEIRKVIGVNLYYGVNAASGFYTPLLYTNPIYVRGYISKAKDGKLVAI